MYQVMRMISTVAIKRKRMSSLDSIRPRPLWFWLQDRIFWDLSHFTSCLWGASESNPPLKLVLHLMLSLESYSGCQLRSKDSLALEVLSTARLVQVTCIISLCAQTARRLGGFLIKIWKREAAVHTTIHKVYKKTWQLWNWCICGCCVEVWITTAASSGLYDNPRTSMWMIVP